MAYSRKENRVMIKMAPGSGKTYIVIKLIYAYKQEAKNYNFKILTSNDYLKRQFTLECEKYHKTTSIGIYKPSEVFACTAQDIVFIDEADESVLEGVVKFDSQGVLTGLYNLLKAKKIYFLSATLSPYAQSIIQHVFCQNDEPPALISLPSPIEMAEGGSQFEMD